jgi:hypothetical protein
MKVQSGCAICGSTWGDYWREIDGERMFFCCEICADEFENMLREIKKRTGWREIDEIKIEGDYRGRVVSAKSGDGPSYKFVVRFDSKGAIQKFEEVK